MKTSYVTSRSLRTTTSGLAMAPWAVVLKVLYHVIVCSDMNPQYIRFYLKYPRILLLNAECFAKELPQPVLSLHWSDATKE